MIADHQPPAVPHSLTAVELNGAEVKRIDSPFVTKCILQLGTQSSKTHRGCVGVKMVAAGENFSESAQLELWNTEANSSKPAFANNLALHQIAAE
ncbi:hypothetical protein X801_06432 [Opisthorchis viverrini]|uniref:Uncharacterized protein n=1 Tax=Opisthorchis viverrini TaxID=6198 RepID=A0A1S8WTG3_OPIVI|nr:hypothetical protein X801_06432 [Opisthorchis viverrini]